MLPTYVLKRFHSSCDKSVDYFTGLPYYPSLKCSPFSTYEDYDWYRRQFQPIRHYHWETKIIECPDYAAFRQHPNSKFTEKFHFPLNLRSLALKAMLSTNNISAIETEIYDALEYGKDCNLPCRYITLERYFNLLKDANLYLCTTNLLREIVKRDCVEAFKAVLKVFGQKDIPGNNFSRNNFFISLLQHLLIWNSVHIKKYIHDIFEQTKNNPHLPPEKHILPTRLNLVQLHKYSRDWEGIYYSYIPKDLLRRNESYVPLYDSSVSFQNPAQDLSVNLSKKLFVVNCPIQAHRCRTNILYSCGMLEQHRWYDFTNINDFRDLSTPAFLFYDPFPVFP